MLIFGIDKFMSECRAVVNFIGNAVATLFVARWNRELDVDRARKVFAGKQVPPLGPDPTDEAVESATTTSSAGTGDTHPTRLDIDTAAASPGAAAPALVLTGPPARP